MSARDALRRLAKHGYWIDPRSPVPRAWLEEYAAEIRKVASRRPALAAMSSSSESFLRDDRGPRLDPADMSLDDAARMLARPVEGGRVVIRRQEGVTIFWYARDVERVLQELNAQPDESVMVALQLHEYEADPAEQAAAMDESSASRFVGVILNGQNPIAVGEPGLARSMSVPRSGVSRSAGTTSSDEFLLGITPAPTDPHIEVHAYPMLDAPRVVAVGKPFDLVIGLADSPVPGVQATGQLVLKAPAGTTTIPVNVHVVADNFEVSGAWHVTLPVLVAKPTKARVVVRLTPLPQDEPVRLTSLIVHFLMDGVARGSAARHIIVERQPGAAPKADDRGTHWQDAESSPPTLTLASAANGPDIEVDIAKPDGNAAKGTYRCVIRNAHGVPVTDASLGIDLGDDAKTFAKRLIDEMRQFGTNEIVDNLLESVGAIVAAKLPPEFSTTLRGVAARVKGRPITLQLNSAEPYVPWELALVDPPLDPKRPKYLAAQVVMGRWILGDSAVASPPKQDLDVKAMAIMAGMYNATTGLRPLPKALEEAEALAKSYEAMPAVPLGSTLSDLKSLLDASLVHMFKPVGGVEVVHFAGHGEVDPTRPGDAALFLSTGQPLTPLFFRRSKLGENHQPFIFLNACMVGTGGEMLGDFGGFPGACLAGGFSALVAPLWAVNDDVAMSFALNFYKEALVQGGARSVAEVLRDLRSNYNSDKPVPSYLAYVYYGNPYLTLAHAGGPAGPTN